MESGTQHPSQHDPTQTVPLVSVIIPCYNAERWLSEAIDSVLAQTYRPLELIIIDDGSTDGSLAIIERYAQQHPDLIRYETGPNRGGCAARNRGFALSHGEFIQFLDADDYILPEKIERQVRFLQQTGADVVYGDWRAQIHDENGEIRLGPVVPLAPLNVVEHHLAGGVVNIIAMLIARKCVESSGGWDETLKAAQDIDFGLAIALFGADIQYQPGCCFMYRRYGNVTVSTSNPERVLQAKLKVLQKWKSYLTETGQMTDRYRQALASWQFRLARSCFEKDRSLYHSMLAELSELAPDFVPDTSPFYQWIWRIGGYKLADFVASLLRPIRLHLRLSGTVKRYSLHTD